MDKNEVVEEKIRTFVRQRPALPDEPVPIKAPTRRRHRLSSAAALMWTTTAWT